MIVPLISRSFQDNTVDLHAVPGLHCSFSGGSRFALFISTRFQERTISLHEVQ